MTRLDIIALDADDTLWHTEYLYTEAQAEFLQLLSRYHPPEWIAARLYDTEVKNLQHFGYGIKSYALSMIETAIELSEGRVMGSDVQKLINIARHMLEADVQLMDHTSDVVHDLAASHPLMLITKGDLHEQEGKVARSGLATFLKYVEIVDDKTVETYKILLARHGIKPEVFLMVGNSLRSDIWPVLQIGGYAVYIPYRATWAHEVSEEPPATQQHYYRLEHLGQLGELVRGIESGGGDGEGDVRLLEEV